MIFFSFKWKYSSGPIDAVTTYRWPDENLQRQEKKSVIIISRILNNFDKIFL